MAPAPANGGAHGSGAYGTDAASHVRHQRHALYHDDGSSGFTSEGNIFSEGRHVHGVCMTCALHVCVHVLLHALHMVVHWITPDGSSVLVKPGVNRLNRSRVLRCGPDGRYLPEEPGWCYAQFLGHAEVRRRGRRLRLALARHPVHPRPQPCASQPVALCVPGRNPVRPRRARGSEASAKVRLRPARVVSSRAKACDAPGPRAGGQGRRRASGMATALRRRHGSRTRRSCASGPPSQPPP